jgi:hypothetical protein
MAILSKTILIDVSSNPKHYESLGYIIPKYYNKKYYKWYVKRGTTISIKVKDLSSKSSSKVLCKCDNSNCTNGIDGTPVIKWVVFNHINRAIKRHGKFYLCHACSLKNAIVVKRIIDNNHLKGKYGKNHPCYNSKLTDEERKNRYMIGDELWRNNVLKRDNYTCQKCGYVGHKNDGIMNTHHINNKYEYPKQRHDLNNGITLCKDCHRSKINKSIHNLYGTYTTKENYNEFMYYSFKRLIWIMLYSFQY